MKYLKVYLLVILFGISAISLVPIEKSDTIKLNFIWEDDFTAKEQEMVKTWLQVTALSTAQTLGSYPFTVNLYIHKKTANEPVPWARTVRDNEQAIHFHIDTKFSLEEFQTDWTASHELSHLSIPFIGKENMWFSEGYASFWQWQILQNQGVLSQSEIMEKYTERFNHIKESYNTSETFLTTYKNLKSKHNYPAVYWGGACYFFKVNQLLKENHQTTLAIVIQQYQNTNRLKDESLDELINSLDSISNSKVFSKTLKTFETAIAKDVILNTELSF